MNFLVCGIGNFATEDLKMKIAFPVQADEGLESQVYGHFGSAPSFVILDSTSGEFETIGNRDAHHAHGQCQPMKALAGNAVDAIVVGGIGGGALMRLQAQGVRVFRAVEGSVKQNLEFMQSGKLPEFSANMSCAGHEGQGGCQHH
jgi:predicted Fe-Mo cluster-binding NifX family protein